MISCFFFRLFSCGTSKDGDFFLVEWNESEGSIKRTYLGFHKKLAGVVQFDTSKNHFLAVGEDGQVKFWDMDNINVLTSTDAEGGLPVSPTDSFFLPPMACCLGVRSFQICILTCLNVRLFLV